MVFSGVPRTPTYGLGLLKARSQERFFRHNTLCRNLGKMEPLTYLAHFFHAQKSSQNILRTLACRDQFDNQSCGEMFLFPFNAQQGLEVFVRSMFHLLKEGRVDLEGLGMVI